MVTVQEPVPEHPPPLQPANVEEESGVAVSVTVEFGANPADVLWHEAPQLILDGELVTEPFPRGAARELPAEPICAALTVRTAREAGKQFAAGPNFGVV